MSRTDRQQRLARTSESPLRFLSYPFAPLVFSSRLGVNVCFSRKGAKSEKLKAQKTVSIFETHSDFLCCLFVLTGALMTSSLSICAQSLPSTPSTLRVIAADYLRVKGKHNKFFQQVVGAGRAAEVLRADWQR